MGFRSHWIGLLGAATFATAAFVAGCGSSGSSAAPSGPPGTQAPTAKQATLCDAVTTWGDSCAASKTACDDKLASACNGLASVLNPTLLDSARDCASSSACDATPTSCLATSAPSAQARDPHKKLAKSYCDRCASPGAACEQQFLSRDGASKTLAAISLPLSDALVDEIESKCTATDGCSATFVKCAQGVVTKAIAQQLDDQAASCIMRGLFEDVSRSASSPQPEPGCQPATCDSLGKSCGKQDDGCGNKIDCGTCPTNCQPKTCAALGKTCGTWDDGCGGTASCGPCATSCGHDDKEPNDDKAHASDLGAFTDSPASSRAAPNLSVPDGDEDWFMAKVTDAGWWGNPYIVASTARSVEVTAFYVCTSGGDASTCPGNAAIDNTIGHGCAGTSSVALQTECSGIDESGTLYVRVRKTKSDGQCGGYTLNVNVTEGS